MKCTDFTFLTNDGITIFYKKWETEGNISPKGVIQIAHGMAEHIERYDLFAKALIQEGYVVYGNDHRGHGKTGKNASQMGFFAEENGFDLVVEDMLHLTNIIKKDYPNKPIFLFGHSMGSFLSRRYIQRMVTNWLVLFYRVQEAIPDLLGRLEVASQSLK